MDIRLPRLGEGADSGTVAAIFVKEGDRLAKDQAILELESEKAVASIPSPSEGVVSKIHVKEGEVIKVGQLLISLGEGAGQGETRAAEPQPQKEESDQKAAPVQPQVLPSASAVTQGAAVLTPVSGPPPPASPTVRKIARDLDIDLRRVKGSEPGGRVGVGDLRRYVQWLQETALKPAAPSGAGSAPVPPPPVDFSRWGPIHTKRITTLRKTISTKMVESWTRVPHVTQFDEADITGILALRKKYLKAYEKQGVRLTLTTFALRAVANALRKHPLLNASIQEATGEIVLKEYYHIGLAVDTEHGLIVPVVRDVEKKNLVQLSGEVQLLADKARERKLAIEEMQGGTFSISNQGGIGGGFFTPIINTPETAILGMGRSAARPVIREGKVVERTILPLGLSYDHRLVDGADAARFMVDLVKEFELFSEADVKL
ncbi:MAG: 2-oxo acid dehydrogenase subunit E2 [Bacteroidetes bacterium]|nr:2-oxo acid dehydrogenase subunit E2 [Bacteroidota bacterium]